MLSLFSSVGICRILRYGSSNTSTVEQQVCPRFFSGPSKFGEMRRCERKMLKCNAELVDIVFRLMFETFWVAPYDLRRDFPPLPVLRDGSMPSFRHRPPRIPPAEAPAATSGKQNCISYFLIFNRLNPRYPNSPPKSDPTHPRRGARLQTRLPPQLRRPPVPVLYKLLSYWIWLYINRDGCCIRPDRMYFAVPRSIRPYR